MSKPHITTLTETILDVSDIEYWYTTLQDVRRNLRVSPKIGDKMICISLEVKYEDAELYGHRTPREIIKINSVPGGTQYWFGDPSSPDDVIEYVVQDTPIDPSADFITDSILAYSEDELGSFSTLLFSVIDSEVTKESVTNSNIMRGILGEQSLSRPLPGLAKHKTSAIDKLLKNLSQKHKLSHRAIEDLFQKHLNTSPSSWIKDKLDEESTSSPNDEIKKCANWAIKVLGIKNPVKITVSSNQTEAHDNHHTGQYVPGTHNIWVYTKDRLMADILRTVLHELVHVLQDENGTITPGQSFAGSKIEQEADQIAGIMIKVYGKDNPRIFTI